jgi:hypothetical protein
MSENKDEKYRKEFLDLDTVSICIDTYAGVNNLNHFDTRLECYIAGRKASEEEIDKWKKCSSDNEQFWQFRRTEMLQEIESLKKELGELRKANYEVESGNHDTALVDIKKLRSLVEQARLMILEMNTAIGFYVTNEDGSQEPLSKKWLKEAQELLGRGL